mmetsp:Transcript_35119/g.91199  ORF Transcript_35119/g.91199 Transcript_35119/m.91199 type:complete len:463 (-) Transcript_35119:426-1814(-)
MRGSLPEPRQPQPRQHEPSLRPGTSVRTLPHGRASHLSPLLGASDSEEVSLDVGSMEAGGAGSRLEQRAGADNAAAAAAAEMPAQTSCWACRTLVHVPVVDGQLAPEFKCGHCGAITQKKRARPGQKRTGPGLGGRCCDRVCAPFEWLAGTRLCGALGWGLQWLTVAFVLGIITSIIGMGIMYVLPHLEWRPLHWFLAALFSFNIYFNYYQVVRQSPGSPQEIPGFRSLKAAGKPERSAINGSEAPEPEEKQSLTGAYDNYTLCAYCEDFKPPQAHHCRICNRCVLEMDHHCPFVNNCIGASNIRPFMLFLAWAASASLYSMTAGMWVFYYNRHMYLPRLARYRASAMNPLTSGVMAMVDMIADGLFTDRHFWIIGTFFVMFLSAGVTIGVGVLFFLQLQQLLAGVSYIDTLKHGKDNSPVTTRMKNLQKVFGTGHPLTWWLPLSALPQGAATLQHVIKKGE